MSVVGAKAENICSQRVFRFLTHNRKCGAPFQFVSILRIWRHKRLTHWRRSTNWILGSGMGIAINGAVAFGLGYASIIGSTSEIGISRVGPMCFRSLGC